ncbi:hypothetical protein AgCh_018949 [Apium graveolens]
MDMENINLYEAAISGDANAIEKLREKAQERARGNKTILHTESMYGNTENLLFILKEFANRSFLFNVDSNGETALHLAAYYGHTEVVKALINAARSLPSSADDAISPVITFIRLANYVYANTALHLAVSNHNVDIVKVLVEEDPTDTHIQNSDGDSPVYLAAERGYNDIVKLICRACRAPNFRGPNNRTALHAVITRLHEAEKDDSDVVEVLIFAARGSLPANYGFGKHSMSSGFENFVRQETDDDWERALHIAVRGNHLNVVKLLLQLDPGYPLEDTNGDSKSPIYIAAELGYEEILQLLCESCSLEYTHGPRGESALHAAVKGLDKYCVDFIVRRAPRLVTYVDDDGWTPLHHAAYYRFDAVLVTIVNAQESIRYQCVYREKVPTPLCVAAKEEHTSTVILLMRLLPSLCATADYDGRNILHFAAMKSNKEMMYCILYYCPPNYTYRILNHKDCDGNTPLHLLIREGCFFPELMKHQGVDKKAKNKKNWTPLDMLYFEDTIVADQLLIRKWLDLGKSSMRRSLVPPSKLSKKDREFKKTEEMLMKQGLELYKERTSTQIVVTALIATVAFTVGFTMPGGYIQSEQKGEGLVVLSKKKVFTAFMIADALALVLSTTSLFLYFTSSMYQDPHQVSKLNAASTGLNIVSVIAMMLTFITGTNVVLSNSPALAITVCIIGCIFFLIVIVLSLKMLYDGQRWTKILFQSVKRPKKK